MATPNELLEYQAVVRHNLDRFMNAAAAVGPPDADKRQVILCIAVELMMRAGLVMGVAANCDDPDEQLAPVDRALREYQRLSAANDGFHMVIVEKRGGEA